MIPSLSSRPANAVSALFCLSDMAAAPKPGAAEPLGPGSSGRQSMLDRTIGAIAAFRARILPIVNHANVASLPDAMKAYAENGDYSITWSGEARGVPDEDMMDLARKQANGGGPNAELARLYLAAKADGSLREYDMAEFGVNSVMTITNFYTSAGMEIGGTGSYQTTGFEEFLEEHVVVRDGMLFDKATGKHADISQNGSYFTYAVF